MNHRPHFWLACCAALAAGCTQFGLQARPVETHAEEFSTDSGLRYEDTVIGVG